MYICIYEALLIYVRSEQIVNMYIRFGHSKHARIQKLLSEGVQRFFYSFLVDEVREDLNIT